MSQLQFVGDLGLVIGAILALLAGALAWWVYSREVSRRGLDPSLKWKLPPLRAIAVFMLILMLTGPVLMRREVIGQVARVLVFLDASQSMALDDRHMEPGRKLLLVSRAGWLPAGKLDPQIVDAVDQLAEAQRIAAIGSNGSDRVALKQAADAFVEQIAIARESLAGADLSGFVARAPRGSITREVWTGVGTVNPRDRDSVDRVTANPPASSTTESRFQSPQNFGDNYVQRMRGLIHPPTTGEYRFYIHSDDASALYLASDENPRGPELVANMDSATSVEQWPGGSAESKPIKLEAGRAYYIEAIHDEGGGNDFVGVGWRLPDGRLERPIDGQHLSPVSGVGANPAGLAGQIESEMITPARALSDRGLGEADAAAIESYRRELAGFADVAARYEAALRGLLDRVANELLASEDPAVIAAFDRFDATPRWQRAQSILLNGEESMLASLASSHDVELITLDGRDSRRLWTPTTDRQPPAQLAAEPSSGVTDLSSVVRERTGGSSDSERGEETEDDGRRTAVIVVSDGRHNDGESPLRLAQVLGDRRVPVYSVSMGSTTAPKDLAVLNVEAPQAVYKDDRVRGRILIADHMPAGTPFTLRIEHEGKTLWSQPLNTADVARRWVDYDFPIDKAVEEKVAAAPEGVTVNAVPMDMRVVIDAVEGEQRTDNNDAPLNLRATTQRRRVLIIDGRPRWETRYIRNLFERDERWEVNTIFVGSAADRQQLRRGEADGEFPADREQMFNYDLIVFGEVEPDRFETNDLQLIRELVADRAAGLVLLDGIRGYLRGYADTPLADLMPVEWGGSDGASLRPMTEPTKLAPTDDGERIAALQLSGDPTESAELWSLLPKPKRVMRVTPLPDTQTLLEAYREEDSTPVLVYRRFGAGQVLYSASDEYWRWRYNVADRYHQRMWHQIANWIMEPPYATSDRFVSLDAGGPVYRPGEQAMIRARLRDTEGKPIVHATVQAVLWRDDQRVATVTLAADESAGGAFRGRTEPLEPGDYRTTIEVTGFTDEQMLADTRFTVRPPESGELALMTANEQLLQQMAEASDGRFLREEQAQRIPELLKPLSAGKVVESETALWQSYWWFIPMIAALSLEWWIRKRAGMI